MKKPFKKALKKAESIKFKNTPKGKRKAISKWFSLIKEALA